MTDRRWVSVAVVVAVAVLAVSAQPVTAANVALVSQHTTASDFSDASLSTSSVVRSGDTGAVESGDHISALQARYPLDTTGSTVYNHRGPLSDGSSTAPAAPGIRGLGRDVSDDYLSLGTLSGSGDLVVSAWINPNETKQSWIVNNYGTGASSHFILGTGVGEADPGQPILFVDDGGTSTTAIGSTSIPNGEWTHLMGVYNASTNTASVYVDGAKVGEEQHSGSDPVWDERSIRVGLGRTTEKGDFKGRVDEVRIYQGDTLSQTQRQYVAESPTVKLASLSGDSSINTTHDVGESVGGYADLELRNATATVSWYNSADDLLDQRTISTTSNVSGSWMPSDSDSVRLSISISPTSRDYTARLLSEGIRAENRAPTLVESSASPDGTAQSDNTLSIELTDREFGLPQGDSVTVTFRNASDGSVIGTDTLTSNGTASTTWDGVSTGSKEWTAEASDSYGGAVGPTQSFVWPIAGELKIYKETNPDQLISDNNVTLRVRFFDRDAGEVFERTTTNGTIDLSGLPADRRFVVTIDANATSEFYYRRIILQSVIDTSEIYLLPTSATSAEVEFSLQDYTGGQFPPADTRLYIDSPIRKDFNGDGENETRYRTIFGDTFGSAGEFTAVLQQDERYRLRIINEQGERRVLGSYTAARDGVERIAVKGLTFENVDGDGYTTNTTVTKGNLTWKYTDPTASTTNLNITVRAANGTVVYQDEVTREIENYSVYQVPLDNGTQYDLAWNATRNGERIGAQQPIGSSSVGIRIPFDSDWLGTLGTLMVVFTLSLAGERKMSYVSMSAVAMAGVLMALQAVDIYPPLWWLGALIAVGAHIRTMQEPGR